MAVLWLVLVTTALLIVLQSIPSEGSGTVIFRLANLSLRQGVEKVPVANATICACLRRWSGPDGTSINCTTDQPGLSRKILSPGSLQAQSHQLHFLGSTERLKLALELYLPHNIQPIKHSVLVFGSNGHWSSWSTLQAGGQRHRVHGQLQVRWRISCGRGTPCPAGVCSRECDHHNRVKPTPPRNRPRKPIRVSAPRADHVSPDPQHRSVQVFRNKPGMCNKSSYGQLFYGEDDHALRVCDGVRWRCAEPGSCQALSISEGQDLKPSKREAPQQEQPIIGTVSDFQTFSDGSGDYLVSCRRLTAEFNQTMSYVFKHNSDTGSFIKHQALKNLGNVRSCRVFRWKGRVYLAVVSERSMPSNQLQSGEIITLTWSARKEKFKRRRSVRRLSYPSVQNSDLFTMDGFVYVVIIGKAEQATATANTRNRRGTWIAIYYWRDDSFHNIYDRDHSRADVDPSLQVVATAAAVKHFQLSEYHFLALALFIDEDRSTTELKSPIFVLKVTKTETQHFASLQLFQTLHTLGAVHWEHFKIDSDYFLVVANNMRFNEEMQNDNNGEQPGETTVDSTIFKFSLELHKFLPFQNITLTEATYWHYFSICGDHYLAAGHVSQALDQQGRSTHIPAAIYKWRGVEKFVSWHEVGPEDSQTWQWRHLQLGQKHYLFQSLSTKTFVQSRFLLIDVSYCGCQPRF